MGAGSVLAFPNRGVVPTVFRNKKHKEAVDFDGFFVFGAHELVCLREEVRGQGSVMGRRCGLYEILLAIL